MRKVDIGDTTKRNALLRLCMDKGMSANTVARMVEPMAGKTNEEKERIAEMLTKQIEQGENLREG